MEHKHVAQVWSGFIWPSGIWFLRNFLGIDRVKLFSCQRFSLLPWHLPLLSPNAVIFCSPPSWHPRGTTHKTLNCHYCLSPALMLWENNFSPGNQTSLEPFKVTNSVTWGELNIMPALRPLLFSSLLPSLATVLCKLAAGATFWLQCQFFIYLRKMRLWQISFSENQTLCHFNKSYKLKKITK